MSVSGRPPGFPEDEVASGRDPSLESAPGRDPSPPSPSGRDASPPSVWPRLLRLLAVLLALGAIFYSFRNIDLAKAWQLLSSVGPVAVTIVIPYGLALGLDGLAFRGILADLGQRVRARAILPIRVASEAVFMSFAGGTVLAESLVPWLLARRHGVPVPHSVVAGAARKRLFILANGLYLSAGLALGLEPLLAVSQTLTGTAVLPWLLGGAAAGLLGVGLGVGLLFQRGALAARVRRLLLVIPSRRVTGWLERHAECFLEADAGLKQSGAAPLSELLGPLLLYTLVWLTELGETLLILHLLGVELSPAAIFGMEMSTALVRSLAFFVPAGLGVQDLGYTTFLRALGVQDALDVSFAFVLLKRAKEVVYVATGYSLLAWMSRVPEGVTDRSSSAQRSP